MANIHSCLEDLFTDIADAIREKHGIADKLCADNFPNNIRAIRTASDGGSGITPTGTKTITTNGTHDVTSYAYAEVNVPTTGGDVVYGNDIEVGSLSELHSWEKYTPGGTFYRDVKTDQLLVYNGQSKTIQIEYADKIVHNDNGLALSSEGYNNVSITSSSGAAVLKGKAVRVPANATHWYYEIPSTATISYSVSGSTARLTASEATHVIYNGGEDILVGIVVSEDSTAYPQNGTQGDYKYVYNGTLDNSGCDHTSVAQATPVITVNSGVITATSTQSAGLVSAGTKTATKSDANLVAGNIKQGVTIFGVAGTYVGGSDGETELDGAYVWQKCTIDHGWHYTTEELGTTKPSDLTGTARQSFTITDDGYFELSTETAALGGYYSISGGNGKSIYYSVWKYASSGSYYTYSKLTLPNSANDAKGQLVSHVTSDSENAYPNNGASGGYWYVKLVAVDA